MFLLTQRCCPSVLNAFPIRVHFHRPIRCLSQRVHIHYWTACSVAPHPMPSCCVCPSPGDRALESGMLMRPCHALLAQVSRGVHPLQAGIHPSAHEHWSGFQLGASRTETYVNIYMQEVLWMFVHVSLATELWFSN